MTADADDVVNHGDDDGDDDDDDDADDADDVDSDADDLGVTSQQIWEPRGGKIWSHKCDIAQGTL